MKQKRDMRRQRAVELRRAGWSYGDIGKELGVSRQRVHQIAKEEGVAGGWTWRFVSRYACACMARKIGMYKSELWEELARRGIEPEVRNGHVCYERSVIEKVLDELKGWKVACRGCGTEIPFEKRNWGRQYCTHECRMATLSEQRKRRYREDLQSGEGWRRVRWQSPLLREFAEWRRTEEGSGPWSGGVKFREALERTGLKRSTLDYLWRLGAIRGRRLGGAHSRKEYCEDDVRWFELHNADREC